MRALISSRLSLAAGAAATWDGDPSRAGGPLLLGLPKKLRRCTRGAASARPLVDAGVALQATSKALKRLVKRGAAAPNRRCMAWVEGVRGAPARQCPLPSLDGRLQSSDSYCAALEVLVRRLFAGAQERA